LFKAIKKTSSIRCLNSWSSVVILIDQELWVHSEGEIVVSHFHCEVLNINVSRNCRRQVEACHRLRMIFVNPWYDFLEHKVKIVSDNLIIKV